ncbi:hypothetical protein BJ508DRAFT_312822 [Ascobolus immersus RN42]|uniref:F-box domain-containing protein n=1 Tax=Ascobolus immersus RN42 TaxID=1160509 RepID=A0A3N4HL12_ASCIM|nr:hypothetical protein BJ508DRAFT_312822 [Ascobolus immersus RN42]
MTHQFFSPSLGSLSLLPVELRLAILSYLSNVELIRCVMPVSRAWAELMHDYCVQVRLRSLIPVSHTVLEQMSSFLNVFLFFYAKVKSSTTRVSSLERLIDSKVELSSTTEIYNEPHVYASVPSGKWVGISPREVYRDEWFLYYRSHDFDIDGIELNRICKEGMPHDYVCLECDIYSEFRLHDFREIGDRAIITCVRIPDHECLRSCSAVLFAVEIFHEWSQPVRILWAYKGHDLLAEEVSNGALDYAHALTNQHHAQTDADTSFIIHHPPHRLQHTEHCGLIHLNSTMYLLDHLSGMMIPWLRLSQTHLETSTSFEVSPREKHTLMPFTSGQYVLTTRPFYHDANCFGVEFIIRDANIPASSEKGGPLFYGAIPMDRMDWWESIGMDDTIHFEAGDDYMKTPDTESIMFYYCLYSEVTETSRVSNSEDDVYTCYPLSPVVWTTSICLSNISSPSLSNPTFSIFPLSLELYPDTCFDSPSQSYRHILDPTRRTFISEVISHPTLTELTVESPETIPMAGAIFYYKTASHFAPESSPISKPSNILWPVLPLVEVRSVYWTEEQPISVYDWEKYISLNYGWGRYTDPYAPKEIRPTRGLSRILPDRVEFGDRVCFLEDQDASL